MNENVDRNVARQGLDVRTEFRIVKSAPGTRLVLVADVSGSMKDFVSSSANCLF